MPEITIHVPCVPIAQPRQRHRVMHMAGRAIAQNYTPTDHPANAFKASVRMAFREVWSGPPLTVPLRLDCLWVFPRPRAMIWKKRPMPRVPHITRPDRDNLDKAVLDALKGHLFQDDSQAYCGTIEKWVAAGDEQPHVMMTVQWETKGGASDAND